MVHYPIALQVDFSAKDDAKARGAKWNAVTKQWEARNPAVHLKCDRYVPVEHKIGMWWDREWLDVPFAYREHAKRNRAKFDKSKACWYVPMHIRPEYSPGLDRYRFRFWSTSKPKALSSTLS
jgi:hypothetical protein